MKNPIIQVIHSRRLHLPKTSFTVGVLIAPAVIFITLIFIFPFFQVMVNSFFQDNHFAMEGFQKTFTLYRFDILYTIVIALLSLLITLLITISIAGYLRLYQDQFLEFLFKIPLFIPFVVVGHAMRTFLAPHGTLNSLLSLIGILNLSHSPSIVFSPAGIITALVWKNMGFALLLIMAPFKMVSDAHLQAAQNLGAGPLRLIKDIMLPMSASSIATSSILMFTSMLASFAIPVMMGNGQGPQMLMVDLYYRITYLNDYRTANVLGLISFLLSLGAAYYYVKRVLIK